jgi:multidrug efflux pump subunit AcrA (membrane-fusion protein)
VTVAITTGGVNNALAVPVSALLARPGGGYTVEVTGPRGHRLVGVTPGLFDDAAGLVQVTGSGLAAGQHVVVPTP